MSYIREKDIKKLHLQTTKVTASIWGMLPENTKCLTSLEKKNEK